MLQYSGNLRTTAPVIVTSQSQQVNNVINRDGENGVQNAKSHEHFQNFHRSNQALCFVDNYNILPACSVYPYVHPHIEFNTYSIRNPYEIAIDAGAKFHVWQAGTCVCVCVGVCVYACMCVCVSV